MPNNNTESGRKPSQRSRIERLRASRTLYSVFILLLCFALAFGGLILVAAPKQYDIEIGEPAPAAVKATKDVEDKLATEKRRQEARDRIVEVPAYDEAITQSCMMRLEEIIELMEANRTGYLHAVEATPTPSPVPSPTPTPSHVAAGEASGIPEETPSPTPSLPVLPTPSPTPDPREVFLPILQDELSFLSLNKNNVSAVLQAQDYDYENMLSALRSTIGTTLESRIAQSDGDAERLAALQAISIDLTSRWGVHSSLMPVCNAIANECVRVNVMINEEATELARQQAEDAVEPEIIKKGQSIVQDGQIVTRNQYAMLQELGLLSSGGFDLTMYIGVGALISLLFGIVLTYMLQFERQMLRKPKMIFLLSIIIVLQLVAAFGMKQISIYIIPVQLASLLIAVLIGPRLAIIMNMVIGIMIGIMATGDEGLLAAPMFQILLMTFIGGSVAVFITKYALKRSRLLYSGLVLGVVNFITIFCAGVLINTNMGETINSALYAAGSGMISALLAVALLPLLESTFNLITSQMLLELSTPTQPLLRLLQTEAPGTYHHSILVANLAEAAADRVGANALLCRVGAYYHDIGKTRRPIFFKENQMDQPNPHDGMEPQVSASILASHVRDGLAMADKAKLPQRVKDLIVQHHGDGIMAFFYYKAKEAAKLNGTEANEADFRYDGPKPQTKEAAILMLADGVEAATRTLKDRSPSAIAAFVHRLVGSVVDGGQLSEAPVTFRDIDEIEKAFVKTLTGIYHERIEYPTMPEKAEEKALGDGLITQEEGEQDAH